MERPVLHGESGRIAPPARSGRVGSGARAGCWPHPSMGRGARVARLAAVAAAGPSALRPAPRPAIPAARWQPLFLAEAAIFLASQAYKPEFFRKFAWAACACAPCPPLTDNHETMRHNQLERELELMILLTENRGYTVDQLCERLAISRRNLYYYIDFFRQAGFIVEKRGPFYSLDKASPFFTRLFQTVHFTEDEATTIRRVLDRAGGDSLLVRHIRSKLDRLYDLDILDDVELREQAGRNVSVLYDAIKAKNKVVLHNYSSPHSNTVASRVVEPFMFLAGNEEVRCYEISSGMNKTFKVARMESVEMLLDPWEHEAAHRQMYTDIFMFSGEELMPVELRLDRLAYSLLTEEYPRSLSHIRPDGDRHWLLSLGVCSYMGIGRFVLGLFEDIEVLGGEGFVAYIDGKRRSMALPGQPAE